MILVFYPGDFTPVCGDQLTLYNELLSLFGEFDAQLLNLPPPSLPSEILVFGYPEFQQEPRSKKSLEKLVFRNMFKG